MNYLLTFLILISLSLGATAMNSNTTHITLENGLDVILVQDDFSPVISARTYVRAGSIDEGKLLGGGASHYLEHLVAGGSTSKNTEDTYKNKISLLGGAYNAYTTLDHTAYFINTTPEYTKDAVQILYEWMFYNTLDKKEFDRERSVIQKEIEKNNAHLMRKFYYQAQRNFFKTHPIRFPVIGYLDRFNEITREELETYYKTFYVPSNMALVIAGNLNRTELLTQIKETFGSQPMRPKPVRAFTEEPAPFGQRVSYDTGDTNITYYSIRFSTVDLYSPHLYALDLLDYILGNGEDSVLYKTIVEKKKLAYSVNVSSYTPDFTTGYFDITAELDEDNIEAYKKEVFSILNKVKEGKISKADIQKAKKQKNAERILEISSAEDKASEMGQSILYGHSTTFYDDYTKNFNTLEKDDLVKAAKQFFNRDKAAFTQLSPKQDESSNKKSSDNASASKKPELISLENGIKILYLEDTSISKVLIQTMVYGGLRKETKETNGIGHLLMDHFGRGSKKYSKEKVLSLIEGNGADISAGVGNNTYYFSLQSLTEDINTTLPVYLDAWLNPVFSESELKESKRLTLKNIEQRKDDWHRYGAYISKKVFYGDHPYGLAILGEKDTINTLTLNDISTEHGALLNPRQTVITVIGNGDKEWIVSSIKKATQALSKSKNQFNEKRTRLTHNESSESFHDIPQDVSGLFINFDGETLKETDKGIKLDLVDSVLSGMRYPGGRLHNLLREKGYVYMVHASNQQGIERGKFSIVALTSKDKVEEVKKLIFEQIESIKKKKVSNKEFEEAIAQMKFYYKDRAASYESLATILATYELYGKGYQFGDSIDEKIEALTKQDVQDTATEYLVNPQVFIFQPAD